ncbi:MAG: polysaccharide biosynthesis C-terminal domain-containing protein [Desulfohalobiaceae bacterium]|nr:polysaccharide biosynthesis C-terminal domain-containing protein [Desulfohalobiaceae bacterium]
MVAARWLSTADYGRLVLVLSILTWAENFQGAALSGAVKAVSEDHRRLYAALRVSIKWFLPSGVIGGLLLFASAPFIAAGLGDHTLMGLLILAAVEIPLTALLRMTARFGSSMRRYAMSSVINSFYTLGRTAFGCALIILGLGAMGGIAGQVVATALVAGIGLLLLLRATRGLARVDYPQMLPRSLLWAGYSSAYAIGISTLIAMDMWCVKGLIADAAQAGFYGAAFALARIPKFLMQAVADAVFPRVSHSLAQGRAVLAATVTEEAFRTLIIMFVPLCVLVGESANEIVIFLFSDRYAAAGKPLAILMSAISVYAFFQLLLSLTEAANRPGLRMAIALGLVPVGLALNFWLIPHYGLTGAATATLITMTVGVLGTVPLVLRYTGAKVPFRTLFRCGVAGMLVYMAAHFWGAEGCVLIPKLILLSMFYIVLLFVMGELGKKEVRSAVNAFPEQTGFYIQRLTERWLR